jgi:hypothetical protein
MPAQSQLVLESDEQILWQGEPGASFKILHLCQEVLSHRNLIGLAALCALITWTAQLISPNYLTLSTCFCLIIVFPVVFVIALIRAMRYVNCQYCLTNKSVLIMRDKRIDEQIKFKNLERIRYCERAGMFGNNGSHMIFYSDTKLSWLDILKSKRYLGFYCVDSPTILLNLPPDVREAALASVRKGLPVRVSEIGKISDKQS